MQEEDLGNLNDQEYRGILAAIADEYDYSMDDVEGWSTKRILAAYNSLICEE